MVIVIAPTAQAVGLSSLVALFAFLSLVFLAFAATLGVVRPKNIFSVLVAFVIFLSLFPILIAISTQYWAHASIAVRCLAILFGFPLMGLLVVRLLFGRLVFAVVVGNLLYHCLRWAVRWIVIGTAACAALLGNAILKLWAVVQGWP